MSRYEVFPRAACAMIAVSLLAVSSGAATISFDQITSNGVESPVAQLTAEVTDPGGGQVLFKFVNDSGVGSIDAVITQIYWDDDLGLLSNGPVVDAGNTSGGVSFTNLPANPSNVPSGNNAGFSADFSAGRTNQGGVANGVDDGEMVGFLFDGDTAAAIEALMTGDLRLGLHVQSIGLAGQSESFVSVPEPTAALLVLASVFGVAGRRKGCRA